MIDTLDIERYKHALQLANNFSNDPKCKVCALIYSPNMRFNSDGNIELKDYIARGVNTLSFGFQAFLEEAISKDIVDSYEVENAIWNNPHLKSLFVTHAEINALRIFGLKQSHLDPLVGTMYITKAPCYHCALEIGKHDIKRIVIPFLNKDSKWYDSQMKAIEFLKEREVVIDYIEV